MSAFATCLFLLLFYFVPAPVVPRFEWVWVHAREHLPWLMLREQGRLVWNGAYYVEMLGYWSLCLLVVSVFEWVTRRDDPAWGGLFEGFERRSGLGPTDLILTLLFAALIVYCYLNGYPMHGAISAGTAVVGTLVIGPALAVRRKKGKEAKGRGGEGESGRGGEGATQPSALSPQPFLMTQDSSGQEKEAEESEGIKLDLEAPALKEEEPPGIAIDRLEQRAREAVRSEGAPAMTFISYDFTPPPPADSRLRREDRQQIAFYIPQDDYLAARARAVHAGDKAVVAREIAEAGENADIRYIAGLVAGIPTTEPRYRVRRVLDFIAGMENQPVRDGGPRLPLVALHDRAATETEKAWLATALLRAAGFEAALWRQPDEKAPRRETIGVAVHRLYDPDGYVGGVTDRQTGEWLLCHPSGITPDPSRARVETMEEETAAAAS